MRRHDHVRIAVEQRVVRDRLAREHVQRRARDLPAVQRILQRRVVDQLAARAVDHPHAVTHRRERLRVQEPLRLRRAREMHGDEVGLRVDLGRGLRAARRRARGSAPRSRTGRRRRSASRTPARAPRRAGRSGRTRAPPASSHTPPPRRTCDRSHLPRRQRRMRLRDVARQRQHQRDRVLRRRHDVRLRRIGHDDPALGRRLHVDVVDPDPRAADHLQPVRALDHVGGQLRRRPDQDPVIARRSAPRAPPGDQPTPTSTSNRSRSRSTPESAIFSATRTR